MHPKRKCTLQQNWLQDAELKDWGHPTKNDKSSADCKLCATTISIHSMGRQALISHMHDRKHQGMIAVMRKSVAVSAFLVNSSKKESTDTSTTKNEQTPGTTFGSAPAISFTASEPTIVKDSFQPSSSLSTIINNQPSQFRGLQKFLLKYMQKK